MRNRMAGVLLGMLLLAGCAGSPASPKDETPPPPPEPWEISTPLEGGRGVLIWSADIEWRDAALERAPLFARLEFHSPRGSHVIPEFEVFSLFLENASGPAGSQPHRVMLQQGWNSGWDSYGIGRAFLRAGGTYAADQSLSSSWGAHSFGIGRWLERTPAPQRVVLTLAYAYAAAYTTAPPNFDASLLLNVTGARLANATLASHDRAGLVASHAATGWTLDVGARYYLSDVLVQAYDSTYRTQEETFMVLYASAGLAGRLDLRVANSTAAHFDRQLTGMDGRQAMSYHGRHGESGTISIRLAATGQATASIPGVFLFWADVPALAPIPVNR